MLLFSLFACATNATLSQQESSELQAMEDGQKEINHWVALKSSDESGGAPLELAFCQTGETYAMFRRLGDGVHLEWAAGDPSAFVASVPFTNGQGHGDFSGTLDDGRTLLGTWDLYDPAPTELTFTAAGVTTTMTCLPMVRHVKQPHPGHATLICSLPHRQAVLQVEQAENTATYDILSWSDQASSDARGVCFPSGDQLICPGNEDAAPDGESTPQLTFSLPMAWSQSPTRAYPLEVNLDGTSTNLACFHAWL